MSAWRIPGSGELRGRAAALLRALWTWRDEEARKVDRPAFHILRNDLLIEVSQRFASGDHVEVAHLSGGRRKRFFEAAERALQLPESEWPRFVRTFRPRPTPEHERLFAEFKTRRDRSAREHQIESSLIAPKSVLEALAADVEGTLPSLLPWQRMLLGFE